MPDLGLEVSAPLRGYATVTPRGSRELPPRQAFVVIQPTHLDSTILGLRTKQLPDAPLFWRSRAEDMHFILDHLDQIEATVPGLAGRIDRSRIAAAGHSLGGHTVGLLLGMRMLDPNDSREKDLADPRIKAGVLLAAPGIADDHFADWARQNYPALSYVSETPVAKVESR